MRIAILTYLYNEMISYVYELFPNLNKLNYLDQKKIIDNNISIWASGWESALEEQKISVMTIPTNMPHFLRKWAEENGSKHTEKNQKLFYVQLLHAV